MFGFLRLMIGLCITILIAAFAAFNLQSTDVTYSPIHDSIAVPLYAVILGALGFGFFFGGLLMWINMGGVRKDRRRKKKEIKRLEKEITRLKSEQPVASATMPASDILPAVISK